eukprot:evm.model.NODE_28041_length_1597_cov_21.164684.1
MDRPRNQVGRTGGREGGREGMSAESTRSTCLGDFRLSPSLPPSLLPTARSTSEKQPTAGVRFFPPVALSPALLPSSSTAAPAAAPEPEAPAAALPATAAAAAASPHRLRT